MRVALTQSEERLEPLAAELRARGFEVVRAPLVRTVYLEGPEVLERARELLACPWLLFTSRSAVAAWGRLGLPWNARLGAVGRATGRALEAAGGTLRLLGSPENAAGLADVFLEHPERAGPVGLPQGERALPTLRERLEAAGFATRPLTLYRSALLPWAAGAVNLDTVNVDTVRVDAVVLASPSAVAALPEGLGAGAALVALGPSTAAAIRARGWRCHQAERPDAHALVAALVYALEATVERHRSPPSVGDNSL